MYSTDISNQEFDSIKIFILHDNKPKSYKRIGKKIIIIQ